MSDLLLVDDHIFHREGVRLYLTGQGYTVHEAGDEAHAWELVTKSLAQTTPFAAAVVDISIPPDAQTPVRSEHSLGIRLAQKLKARFPAMGIVLFSAYEDRGAEVLDMVREGTRGVAYKLKGARPDALLQAIQDVIAGRVVIDPEVHANRPALADELLNRLSAEERTWVQYALKSFDDLTRREKEIAERLAAAHNTQAIADALIITPKTVENYIGRIYDKLGLSDTTEAAGLRKAILLAKVCMIHDLRK